MLIYLCWFLAQVVGFLALVSGREWVLAVLAVSEVDVKVVGLIDKVVFFLMGAAGLSIIVLSEGFLKTGARKARLLGRIGLLFGLEFLALFAFDLGRFLLPNLSEAARPELVHSLAALAMGGAGLLVYWRKR